MDLSKRTNDAIHANGDHTVNGGTSDIAITTHGSDWYFVSDFRRIPSTPWLTMCRLSVL